MLHLADRVLPHSSKDSLNVQRLLLANGARSERIIMSKKDDDKKQSESEEEERRMKRLCVGVILVMVFGFAVAAKGMVDAEKKYGYHPSMVKKGDGPMYWPIMR